MPTPTPNTKAVRRPAAPAQPASRWTAADEARATSSATPGRAAPLVRLLCLLVTAAVLLGALVSTAMAFGLLRQAPESRPVSATPLQTDATPQDATPAPASPSGPAPSATAAPTVLVQVLLLESTVLLAAPFGFALAGGRFRDAQAITALSLAGVCATVGVLSYLSLRPNTPPGGLGSQVATWLAILRLACAAVFAAAAVLAAVSRAAQSVGLLVRGTLLLLPPVAVVALLGLGQSLASTPANSAHPLARAASAVLGPQTGTLEIVRVAGLLIGALVLGLIACVAIGTIVRAFEIADGRAARPNRAEPSPPAPSPPAPGP